MAGTLIAVIDEDGDYRDSVEFWLEIEGFRVHGHKSGSGLLQDAVLTSFDCLIIDYHLPDMNGLELVERLVGRGVVIPTILISSDPSRVKWQRVSAAGCPLIEKMTLDRTLIDDVCRCSPTRAGCFVRDREGGGSSSSGLCSPKN